MNCGRSSVMVAAIVLPVSLWLSFPSAGANQASYHSLLVLSLDRDAVIEFTSPQDGVRFDFDSDGQPEQVGWTRRDARVAILAIDRNGDDSITNGDELIGAQSSTAAEDAFGALGQLATTAGTKMISGSLSVADPIFGQILLWTDANHDGVSAPGELERASDLLSDLGLGFHPEDRRDGFGNFFVNSGWAYLRTAPGRNMAASPTDGLARQRRVIEVVPARLHSKGPVR